MRNIAVSFIAGSVFSGIVFFLIFDVTPRSDASTEAQEFELFDEEVSSRGNPETVPETSQLPPVSPPSEPQPAESEVIAVGSPSATPEERLAELGDVMDAARQEATEIVRARALGRLGPVISPVPLPPEFDWLEESVFHEYMQREPIDLSASSKEAQLAEYLFSRPQMVQRYGTPTIRCHTNRCLVTWVSYGSSETADVVQSDLRTVTGAAGQEMTEHFECSGPGGCFLRTHVEDGLATAIWAVKFDGEEVVPGLD